jgi:NlpC/P60 family putative phage cell wall peptidase
MTVFGETVAAEALRWVGTPYRHQGRRRQVGCDCVGLLLGVWRNVLGAAPNAPEAYSPDWAEATGRELLLAALREHATAKADAPVAAGDIIAFRWRPHLPAKHVGIAVSPDNFVHAWRVGGVGLAVLDPHWRRRVAAIFTLPNDKEG